MADRYSYSDDASSPSRAPYAVTPGPNPLNPVPKALYVGTAGDVTLRGDLGSSDVTFKNVASGSYIPVRAKYVYASTTAQDILALY